MGFFRFLPLALSFALLLAGCGGGGSSSGGAKPVKPPPPRLEAFYHLDGNLADEAGVRDLTPYGADAYSASGKVRAAPNQAYGPTRRDDQNGAFRADFTALPEDEGITLAGWVWLPDDSSGGALFGFGEDGWEKPKLAVYIGWGFIRVEAGASGDGFSLAYDRIGDTCWHHLALVLPKGFRAGTPVRLYLDGVERVATVDSSATGSATLSAGASLWGGPFSLGRFVSYTPGGSAWNMKLDEVGIWSRELSAAEITALATPTGVGAACENTPIPNWAPGPRFVAPTVEPTPRLTLGVHVLTDDTIAVISDPNAFLDERLNADCGTYLTAMEENASFYPEYWLMNNYSYAVEEVYAHYKPGIFDKLNDPAHLSVSNMGPAATGPVLTGLWPQATREQRVTRMRPSGGEWYVPQARVVYYSYLKLPKALVEGASYTVTDSYGDAVTFKYEAAKTVSWALKVNQVGYPADSTAKFAYFGSWLGANGGPLNGARFNGNPFYLCRESDGATVFTGTVTYKGDESQALVLPGKDALILSGEFVYELDFSAFSTPGRYFVKLPGAGRSWGFEIGNNAAGEIFYTHLRGLYHARCAPLDAAFTQWPRGDSHVPVYKGAFPPELADYGDHTPEGWGLMDEEGKYPSWVQDWFPLVTATITDEVVLDRAGEWHDAGDFDKVGATHILNILYLSESYLNFPQNFSDGQGNIPESGNGIPDILDEAVWGADLWLRLQEPDGRASLWVEAETHPKVTDAGNDPQRYYRALATRNSSLLWAQVSATLSRALKAAGANALAATYLDSAKRAYAFAIQDHTALPRIVSNFVIDGKNLSWSEPAEADQGRRAKAIAQIFLASGEQAYYDEMVNADLWKWFDNEALQLYWRGSSFEFVSAALESAKLPPGWGASARKYILLTADEWLAGQGQHLYRTPWRGIDHGYFVLSGWGANGYWPMLHFIAAWKLTGDVRYKAAAQNGVNFQLGANPQGRSLTTGLGSNYVIWPLHLPSLYDNILDPVPGITLYGYNAGIPYGMRTWVFGIFENAYPEFSYDGAAIPQVPFPWRESIADKDAIGNFLYAQTPLWRRLANLENWNVPQMEFDVHATIGTATAVTGCLLEPGWLPSPALKARGPKAPALLRDMEWFHP